MEYILTEDTKGIFAELVPEKEKSKANSIYFKRIIDLIIDEFCPKDIKVVGYLEEIMEASLENIIKDKLTSDPTAICISLDRFLGESIENDEKYSNRFVRFSITRAMRGGKVARPGQPDLEAQIDNIKNRFPDLAERGVYLLDDGVFTGGTIKDFITLWRGKGLDNVRRVIGFLGEENKDEKVADLPLELVEKVTKLFEWIDIRDFSLFGGK